MVFNLGDQKTVQTTVDFKFSMINLRQKSIDEDKYDLVCLNKEDLEQLISLIKSEKINLY